MTLETETFLIKTIKSLTERVAVLEAERSAPPVPTKKRLIVMPSPREMVQGMKETIARAERKGRCDL